MVARSVRSPAQVTDDRMWYITTALAVFVLSTSTIHYARMAYPDALGPQSPLLQQYLVRGPPLSSLRLPDGQFHVDHSYPTRPLLIFGLHLTPALLWSVLAPLQFDYKLRSRRRALHRASGYLFFAISLLLDATGLYMIATRFTFALPRRTDLHFGVLPSFDVGLSFLGLLFGSLLILALHAARARDFAKHRLLVTMHVCAGLTVHYQRVLMYSQFILAHLVAAWKPSMFNLIGIPAAWSPIYASPISKVELDAFAVTGYGGSVLATVSALYSLWPILTATKSSNKVS